MKNLLKENWFRLTIIFIVSLVIAVYVYKQITSWQVITDSYFHIKRILIEIGFVLLVIFVFVCIFNYIRVLFIEKKIKKRYGKLENDIADTKSKPMTMQSINGWINRLRDEAKPELEELERKRKFILEKIPFFFK